MKSLRFPGRFLLTLSLLFFLHAPLRAQVTAVTLDNGVRVLVQPSHGVPIVAVDAWVQAGTRKESSSHPGVAHFLEHVLFKGTPTHPTEASIDSAVEDLGGNFNAATSYDSAHFYTTVPAAGFSGALDVLADVLQHASITAPMVESERPIILSEVARNSEAPAQQMVLTARELIYGKTNPYGRSITGSDDDVRAITRDEIAQFYKANYIPSNITLVVTGDVTAEQARAAAQRALGDWKPSAPATERTVDSSAASPVVPGPVPGVRRQVIRREASQSYLVMAFRAPSVKETPDVWTMDVLLTLLGQGGNNRLDTVLHRQKHLATQIGADFLTQRDPGLLTITASLPTGNLDSVEAAILAEINRLRDEPVSDEEVVAAKTSLKASYLFDSETVSGRADTLGFYDMIDTYEYDTHYLGRVQAVTAQDVRDVARKYLTTDAYALVVLVPRTDVTTAGALGSLAVRTARAR